MSEDIQIWRAQGSSPAQRARNWSEQLQDTMLALSVTSLCAERYEAEMTKASIGIVDVSLVKASSQKLCRTREGVSRSREQNVFLVQMRAGTMCFRQYGREAHLGPGDCVVMDGGAPYDFVCPQDSSAFVAHMPTHWLRNWLEAPEDVAGKRLDPSSGWTKALSAVTAMLDPGSVSTLTVAPQLVAENLATLLSLAAGPPAACATPHRRKLLRLALERMRERLDESGLTASVVAADLKLSRRYLHRLFADEGTTFAGELMSFRLQLAERLLSDPQRRHTSITEIAQRCGFTDSGHFARRFRRHTGATPSDFRRK